MRRLIPMLIVALAFTGIACPPPPKEDPLKDKISINKEGGKSTVKVPDALEARVEAAIAQVQSRDLLTTNNFWTVFHGILGSGLEKTKLTNPETKEKTNAIDYICDGGEIKGLQFLPTTHGLDVLTAKGREWEGIAQGHQDQFIAEMAQWGMPIEREFKIGGKRFEFRDFTRFSKAKASITKGQELSWAIIIIAQYYGTEIEPWTNMFGQTIRFDEIVKYELEQSIDQAACGGTHRLFGLTWAYHLHLKNGGQKTGVWKDVEAKIADYKGRAKNMQNFDGSFSTEYFKARGNADDPHLRIGTTGHVVEWLALAMTEEELKSDWMQSAVSALSRMILDMERSEIDSGALYHAAHGLHLYQTRVFGTPANYLALPPKQNAKR